MPFLPAVCLRPCGKITPTPRISEGQSKISSTEFSFGFKDTSREQFERQIAEGNALICTAMDEADTYRIRLRGHFYIH
jgi:hypothetical protein